MRLLAVFGFVTMMGCEDKAQPDYGKCVAAEAKGEVIEAATACEAAVKADPNSTAGKSAATKLAALQPAVTKAKKEKEDAAAKRAEEKSKADEIAAKVAAVAKAQRIASLKDRVTKKYWDDEPNGECTGKGLPPYKWVYEGGTFAEDIEVATAEGCTKVSLSADVMTFCCPQRPGLF